MSKKTRTMNPLQKWADQLEIHERDLARVRLLWRTGSGPYRPVIPISTDLDDLEDAPDTAWEVLELSDTHFHWVTNQVESKEQLREWLWEICERLWTTARRWARGLDLCCDFKLQGFNADDEQLFDTPNRYNPQAPEPSTSRQGPRAAQRPPEPTYSWADYEEGRRLIDELKNSLIEDLRAERNRTDDWYRKMSQEAPSLISRATDVYERAVAFQDKQVQDLIERKSGEIDFKIRAFAEQEETRRTALTFEWRRHAFDAFLGTVVPAAKSAFEAWAHQSPNTSPQFEYAQQAIAYLGMTLDESQLANLFDGKREAARVFVRVLEHASGQASERDAIDALQGSEVVFKSDRFRSAADSEQQGAARFILARAAIFRMGDFDGEAGN